MLTPEQVAALRDACEQVADPITEWLLKDIAERVAQAGGMTRTAAYELYRANALGQSEQALKKYLKKQLKLSDAQIGRLFRQAAQWSCGKSLDKLDGQYGDEIQQTVSAALQLAQDGFDNLTQTLGMVGPNGQTVPLTQGYQEAMDFAFEQVFTGAADYETAIRQATSKLATNGIRVIDYASGLHTSLEAATRRNIMSGLGLMNEVIAQKNHDLLGCDGWEISAHGGSAPDHEPYQGRQYPDAEFTKLNNSLQRRIGTLNCGHVASPIILGVNAPQYTDEELKEFKRQNAEGITYQGRHYILYEASQKQRQIERAQRVQKNRILVADATGDAQRKQTAQIRLNALQGEYKAFSKAAGLPTQPERAQIAGFSWKEGNAARRVAERNAVAVETIGRSVGAKAKNYEILNPLTQEITHMVEGTRLTQPKNHVMAGAGRDRKIDEIDGLLDKYGGDALKWTKEKGFGYVEDEFGEPRLVELHWYQEPSVGKVKMKIKEQPDGRIYIDED